MTSLTVALRCFDSVPFVSLPRASSELRRGPPADLLQPAAGGSAGGAAGGGGAERHGEQSGEAGQRQNRG